MPTLVMLVAMLPVLVIVSVTAAVLPTTVLGNRMTPLVTGVNVRLAPSPVPARLMEMLLLINSWAVSGPISAGANTTLKAVDAVGFSVSCCGITLVNAKFDPRVR